MMKGREEGRNERKIGGEAAGGDLLLEEGFRTRLVNKKGGSKDGDDV
jgi:hypothetical protein